MADIYSRTCGASPNAFGPQKHRTYAKRLPSRKHQLRRRHSLSALNSTCRQGSRIAASSFAGLSSPRPTEMRASSTLGSSYGRHLICPLQGRPAGVVTPSPSYPSSFRARRSSQSLRSAPALAIRLFRQQDTDIMSQLVALQPSTSWTDVVGFEASQNSISRSSRGSFLRPALATRYLYAGSTSTMLALSSSTSIDGSAETHGVIPVPSGQLPGLERYDTGERGTDDHEQDEMIRCPAPSSYTFRRRNAIVEGTEDAPRPKDFREPSAKQ